MIVVATVVWLWIGVMLGMILVARETSWRDIESAPKDGSKIIVYAANGLVTIARWRDYHGEGDKTWRTNTGSIVPKATHWMPVPGRPQL